MYVTFTQNFVVLEVFPSVSKEPQKKSMFLGGVIRRVYYNKSFYLISLTGPLILILCNNYRTRFGNKVVVVDLVPDPLPWIL